MSQIIATQYRSGINLGGWVSQCTYQKEHIATFITKDDIARIASWGVDHVRLPFDYPVLEEDSNPSVYLESGFAVIDSLIEWSSAYGLNVVLDMHKAPGYAFFDKAEDNVLFTSEETQRRFVALWQAMARRYKSERDNVIFELMNEITDPHGDVWNNIARKVIEGIQAVDAGRYILLGGPYYNSAAGLDTLEIYEDEHILYNFHFYEPFMFTHQRAGWTPLKDTGIHQPYPGKVEGLAQLKKAFPSDSAQAFSENTVFDRAYLEEKLAPAFAFAKRTGKPLYCGEYGPIDLADMQSRVNWMRDITSVLNEHNIGKAYWTYKGMNFSSIDKQGNPVSEELIKAIAAR